MKNHRMHLTIDLTNTLSLLPEQKDTSRARQTEIKRHRCQKGERDDPTAGRAARLAELLVDELDTRTGQDSASSFLGSSTQKPAYYCDVYEW